MLGITPAKARKVAPEDSADGGKRGYKSEKASKDKAKAGSSHNWNSLFMRADAVADAVAAEAGLAKGALLDHESGSSMAVRLALGETHVIDRTKAALRDAGVNVAALEVAVKPKERSKRAVLVKNIPHATEEADLHGLFSRFGDVHRLVLPETRTMALVELAEPTEARKAFKALAYAPFKGQPLFLEWAPPDIFVDGAPRRGEGEGGAERPGGAEDGSGKGPEGEEKVRGAAKPPPPPPSLPYKVDTSRPSLRTNWTRLGWRRRAKRAARAGARAATVGPQSPAALCTSKTWRSRRARRRCGRRWRRRRRWRRCRS